MSEDIYKGNWITPDDLGDNEMTLTIKGGSLPETEKAADGQTIKQGVLWFEKTDKGLILGKTNFRILKSDFGPASTFTKHLDMWKGKEITIRRMYLPNCFGEKDVPVIRLVPIKPAPMGVRKFMGKPQPTGK